MPERRGEPSRFDKQRRVYEDPPKHVMEAQKHSKERLMARLKSKLAVSSEENDEVLAEKERSAKLIGQLKAAEARNRIRIMRLRYESTRSEEVSHLVACQPSALRAVRLEAFVPHRIEPVRLREKFDKQKRKKIEDLVREDVEGLRRKP